MQTPYNVEIFAPDFTFRDFGVIESPSITVDYLALDTSTLKFPKLIKAVQGDYVIITNGFQGVVSSVAYDRYSTTLTVKPLQAILDHSVYYDRAGAQDLALEEFLARVVTAMIGAGADADQRVPGLAVTADSSTTGWALNIVDNIQTFYDLVKKTLTKYGVVFQIDLFPQEKRVAVSIHKVAETGRYLEADLWCILAKTFTLKDSSRAVNKMIYVSKNDEAQRLTFYAPDFSAPAVWGVAYIEDSDFPTAAAKAASDAFTPAAFNNLIEITVDENNSIVTGFKIGEGVTVIRDDVEYSTVLTGYDIGQGRIKWIFGAVRLDLTKILKMGAL